MESIRPGSENPLLGSVVQTTSRCGQPEKSSSEVENNGMWRSLAARLLWEQEVRGSNPRIPTICGKPHLVDRAYDNAAWLMLAEA